MPTLLQRLVTSLHHCGHPSETIARANQALAKFPTFTDMVFAQALAALTLSREDDAIAYWQRCIELGDAPSRFGASVSGDTYLPRIALAELYAKRGELDATRELLD